MSDDKVITIEIPKVRFYITGANVLNDDDFNDVLQQDPIELKLTTSTGKTILIKEYVYAYAGLSRVTYVDKYKSIHIPAFEYVRSLKCATPDRGITSRVAIERRVDKFLDEYRTAVLAELQKVLVDTVEITNVRSTQRLGEISNFYIRMRRTNSNAIDAEQLRLKPRVEHTWVPAFGTHGWTILNKAAHPNYTNIKKYVYPSAIKPEYAFIQRYYFCAAYVKKLYDEGYIKPFGRKWQTNPHVIETTEQRIKEGIWVKLTDKGHTYHKKNTDKNFRMINFLSGDPRFTDLEEVKKV